jgi:methyl-accepting chemotaxis protein
MKIGNKLIVMIISLTLLGTGILLGTILYRSQDQIVELTDHELRNLANNEATKLSLWFESYFGIARSLAQSMEGYEEIDVEDRRFFFDLLLEHLAKSNPEIAGVWACWEPNALDGLDARYVNTPGSDRTGRFISYWTLVNGEAVLDVLTDYTVSGPGDFYLIPQRTGKETVAEPYLYKINGIDTPITTLAVPIKNGDRTVGVAGIDLALTKIQTAVVAIKPYEDSAASVFTNGGILAGYFDAERLGKTMDEAYAYVAGSYLNDLKAAVKNGRAFDFINDVVLDTSTMRYKVISVPLRIGETNTPWALGIGVPQAVVNAPVTRMLQLSILISVLMFLGIGVAAFLIARSISNPLKKMMKVFTGVGEGDLTQQLDIQRKDEIGDMAKVFNGTVDNIKNLVAVIKNQSGKLANVGNELASNMTQTAAAINEITANIQSIKGRVINQSASVTETNATMEQITVNIDTLSGHVDRQGESVARS